ncbi:MAG: nitrogenase component 1 [Rikenellaceae bacterium]
MSKQSKTYTSSRNACKLCAPLGASLVFKGIEGCVPLIHGSQGCATYIRRYMISHYKEPVDIASSNFSEESTVYGGSKNFITGIDNIIKQYHPKVIGIASTCLSETIGEDIPAHIRNYGEAKAGEELPAFVHSSTPSYCGSHAEGFHNTVLSAVRTFATPTARTENLVVLPGMVSPADIRYIKEIVADFDIKTTLFPDYSESLDNVYTAEYELIPSGGTPLAQIKSTADAKAVIEFGERFNQFYKRTSVKGRIPTAGEWLESECGVKNIQMPIPIGIEASDKFMQSLADEYGVEIPEKYQKERGRLIDAYVDAHKYLFGKKVVLYGEADLVSALSGWCKEVGMEVFAFTDTDFESIHAKMEEIQPNIMIGSSKGYYIARELKIPLVRLGFPIHDRFGASRQVMLGYRGTQEIFDRVVNALIEYKQENSPVGYKYI